MTHSVTLTIPVTSTSTCDKLQDGFGKNALHITSKATGPDAKTLRDSNHSSTLIFILVIFIWYSVSVGHNMLNKRLLEPDLFPYPFTLTLVQLSFITLYSYLYLKYFAKDDKHVLVSIGEVIKTRRHRRLIILLSLGKFLTLVFSHLSLSHVPLAFTHTVKGSLPLFVVALSRIFLNQKHSKPVYLSLVPIIIGVSMASIHSPKQHPNLSFGIIFAFLSTLNLALLNVFSKKLLSTTFSAISLLNILTKFSLLIFVPFYVGSLLFTHRHELVSWNHVTFQLPFILLLDGFMSFSQNILAFYLLSLCSPLTYSIANCSKRVAIISLSFVFFSVHHLTPVSLSGIIISLVGIFCYNLAKHREKQTLSHRDQSSASLVENEYHSGGDFKSHNGHHLGDHHLKNSYNPLLHPVNSVNGFTQINSNGHSPNGIDFDRHSLGSFYNV